MQTKNFLFEVLDDNSQAYAAIGDSERGCFVTGTIDGHRDLEPVDF